MNARFLLSSIILLSGFTFVPVSELFEASPENARGQKPADEQFAAKVGEHEIGMQDYREYLLKISGRRPLDTLIDRHLVQAEASRLGLNVDNSAVAEAQEQAWQSYLIRYDGDESRFLQDLKTSGFQKADYVKIMRAEAHHELLSQALARATRVVTDEMLQARFSFKYGQRGDLVEVQHIFLSAARMRSDLLSQGVSKNELDAAQLESRCRERLAEALERLESGEEFAKIAANYSHEFAAQNNGGKFASYNYRAYGEEFAAAVRGATVGEPFGPIKTESGFHVIEVISRVHTNFEDVKASLRSELESDDAEMTEIQEMIAKLRASIEIETY